LEAGGWRVLLVLPDPRSLIPDPYNYSSQRPLAEGNEDARADLRIGRAVRNQIRESAESRDGNGDGDGPHRRLVYAAC
jgi:hypothetical protein